MSDRVALTRRSFLKILGSTAASAAFLRIVHAPYAQAVPPNHAADTIEAAVDTLFPTTPGLPHATGAVEVRAHEFVIEAFDAYTPLIPSQKPGIPLSAAVAGALDAHAAQVTPGKTFVEQTTEERIRTFDLMDRSPNGDVRFISFALPGMASLGFYSEWPAYGVRYAGEHESIDLSRLPVWGEIGFNGPADGYPKLLTPYSPGDPLDPRDPSIP